MPESEKVQHKISKWRIADILAPILILVFSMFCAAYSYYQVMIFAAIPVLLVIILMRPLYYKEKKYGKGFRITTTIIRIIGYIVVISAVMLPFTLGA